MQALYQGLPVLDVTLLSRDSQCTERTNYFAKFIFETWTPISVMMVGFGIMKIEEDHPKPRQWQHCWKFGYRAKVCRNQQCSLVFYLRGNGNYNGHCITCVKDRCTTFTKNWSVYNKESEILLPMSCNVLSKFAACKLFEEAGLFKGVAYAVWLRQPPTFHEEPLHQCTLSNSATSPQ